MQKTKDLGLEVRPDAGDGRGKGVFATKPFSCDDLILKELPVVAIQHSFTQLNSLVCSRCFTFVGSIEEQLTNNWKREHMLGTSTDETNTLNALPKLPCSEKFPMPLIVPCQNGPCCDAVYCSIECRNASWHAHHSLLCSAHINSNAEASSTENNLIKDPVFEEFYHQAESTNDVFILAAQAVAMVLLEAERQVQKIKEEDNSGAMNQEEIHWNALEKAWIPFSMGHKALWWEAVALPSDVPADGEGQFRDDMKELAEDSLHLFIEALKARKTDLCTAFPAALHLNIWGSLIGMFELNNLSLLVSSPVPLWAQYVDDAEDDLTEEDNINLEHYKSIAEYGGLEGIMDREEEWICLGNSFYSLQACLNHSCVPNAHAFKREQDTNGDGKGE